MDVFATDDHNIIFEAYEETLKTHGHRLIGTSTSGQGLIDWLENNTCDVVLLDLKMPNMSGIDVLKYYYGKTNIPKFIVVSGYYQIEQVQEAHLLGACGFISKYDAHLVLNKAMLRIMRGKKYFSDILLDGVVQKQINSNEKITITDMLSKKEDEALSHIMENLSTQEICDTMNIKDGTLRKVFQRIREKLNVKSNIELVKLALKHKYKQKK